MQFDQPKAILIGSSFSAAPILFSLKNRNVHVTVCGNDPHDPCHAHADDSIFIDYSKPELLDKSLSKHKFDFLVPSCNDASYLTGASLAAKYNSPGFDSPSTTEIVHTKHLFRRRLLELGLPSPKNMQAEHYNKVNIDGMRFPLLVKPVDSFSGRGMTKITSPHELQDAFRKAQSHSKSGQVLVEEFLEGPLHSHSAFIRDGRILQEFFVDEFCTTYPYQVDSSNHPSCLDKRTCSNVSEQIERLARSFPLVDGLLHTQFLSTPSGPTIVECMRRAPGDLYNRLVERSTGFPYTDYYVQSFLGGRLADPNPSQSPIPCSRHTISTDFSGNFRSLIFSQAISPLEFFPLKNSGERFTEAPFDKFGILFYEHASLDAMFSRTPSMNNQSTVLHY